MKVPESIEGNIRLLASCHSVMILPNCFYIYLDFSSLYQLILFKEVSVKSAVKIMTGEK